MRLVKNTVPTIIRSPNNYLFLLCSLIYKLFYAISNSKVSYYKMLK